MTTPPPTVTTAIRTAAPRTYRFLPADVSPTGYRVVASDGVTNGIWHLTDIQIVLDSPDARRRASTCLQTGDHRIVR